MSCQTEMHANIFNLKQNLLPFPLTTGVCNTFFPVRYFQLNQHQTGAKSQVQPEAHMKENKGCNTITWTVNCALKMEQNLLLNTPM